MSEKKHKKRRKLRISGLIVIILIIYLIAMMGYYLFLMPIKSITVINNNILTEKEVIESSNLGVGIPISKILFNKPLSSLKENPLVKKAKIRLGLLGNITIDIEENKVICINSTTDEVILESGKTISHKSEYKGIPVLVNYVPTEVLDSFLKSFSKIDSNIIKMISEIEYSPDKYNDIILDEERFLLRMNDGNIVFVNNPNIEKLNRYQVVSASLSQKGVLYLNSSSENYIFNSYDMGENNGN